MSDKPIIWISKFGERFIMDKITDSENQCRDCYFNRGSEYDCPIDNEGKLQCDKNLSVNWRKLEESEIPYEEPNEIGIKYDQGKTQWWYMPIQPMKEVISVLEYGDNKYPADDGCNWKKVPNAKKRYYSALIRHITAWWEGEKYDKESGKHHLAHAATNCLFLLWFDINNKFD